MKKIFIYIVTICFFNTAGCSSDETENGLASDTDILCVENDSKKNNTKDATVIMCVKEDTVSSEGLTYTLTNNTDVIYLYSHAFCMSKKSDGLWKAIQTVNNNVAFTDIAIYLNPNQTVEENINWTYYYGKLPQGVYKIEKTIHANDDKHSELVLAFEFEF